MAHRIAFSALLFVTGCAERSLSIGTACGPPSIRIAIGATSDRIEISPSGCTAVSTSSESGLELPSLWVTSLADGTQRVVPSPRDTWVAWLGPRLLTQRESELFVTEEEGFGASRSLATDVEDVWPAPDGDSVLYTTTPDSDGNRNLMRVSILQGATVVPVAGDAVVTREWSEWLVIRQFQYGDVDYFGTPPARLSWVNRNSGQVTLAASDAYFSGAHPETGQLVYTTAQYPYRAFLSRARAALAEVELIDAIGTSSNAILAKWSPDGTRLATTSWLLDGDVWSDHGSAPLLWNADGTRARTLPCPELHELEVTPRGVVCVEHVERQLPLPVRFSTFTGGDQRVFDLEWPMSLIHVDDNRFLGTQPDGSWWEIAFGDAAGSRANRLGSGPLHRSAFDDTSGDRWMVYDDQGQRFMLDRKSSQRRAIASDIVRVFGDGETAIYGQTDETQDAIGPIALAR
jgi:hypothetical protein